MKQRNHRPPASRHISITHDGKINILCPGICICRNKQLVRNQLCAAVQIHRIDRFIRGQCHHFSHCGIQCRVNDILCPVNICLYRLIRIVLTGRHLLQRCGMNHIIHPFESPLQSFLIPHIPDKEAQLIFIFPEFRCHQELLELIP